MMTVFQDLPDLFIEMYDEQFKIWAREFKKRGQYAAIVFNRVPGRPAILGPDGEPVWKGAWLEAEVDHSMPQVPRVVIKPRTEHDAEMILRHCVEMRPHVLN
jgi:hypothetical protein